MKGISLSKSFVPNSFTSLNIVSGFLSIVFASQNEFHIAAIFIIIAAIFDAVDGLVARLIKTSSRFGVELDSLSDVVSFGAAPAFLIYKSYLYQFEWLGIIISSTILIFGAFRLARFNVQLEDLHQKSDFKGLPIPIQAVTIAAFVLAFYDNQKFDELVLPFIIPLTLVLAVLMVSRIRYSAFPKINRKSIKERRIYLAILILGLLLGFLTRDNALFYVFISIVLFGIFRHLYFIIFPSKNGNQMKVNEETN